jgi:hypothetical protein
MLVSGCFGKHLRCYLQGNVFGKIRKPPFNTAVGGGGGMTKIPEKQRTIQLRGESLLVSSCLPVNLGKFVRP